MAALQDADGAAKHVGDALGDGSAVKAGPDDDDVIIAQRHRMTSLSSRGSSPCSALVNREDCNFADFAVSIGLRRFELREKLRKFRMQTVGKDIGAMQQGMMPVLEVGIGQPALGVDDGNAVGLPQIIE